MSEELVNLDEIFLGAKCDFISNTVIHDNAESTTSFPLVFTGVLVDYDDVFYYVGNDEGLIEKAVKRSDIISIEFTAVPDDEQDSYLDSIPTPENGKFH